MIAVSAASRSVVGGSTGSAEVENETMPTAYESGTSSRKARAALFAASKRFGSTSVACIERDVSIVRITVASSRVTSRTTCGRATPTKRSASATSTIAIGT